MLTAFLIIAVAGGVLTFSAAASARNFSGGPADARRWPRLE
jgi:hypothetical protein